MTKPQPILAVLLLLLAVVTPACSSAAAQPSYAQWKNGPSADPNFFPLAVWLQDPADAEKYKAAGINTYVGLWQGPTDAQLATLTAANMHVVCEMNDTARNHFTDPIIVGWMHGDEPDNAQTLPGKDAAGNPLPNQPIPPEHVIAEYNSIRAFDPTRPIMLNLGQGVANDAWPGRGKDNFNFAPYKQYVKAGDIISFDVYPISGNRIPDRGNLALEAKGLDRLTQWTGGKKILWNCIETTQINGDRPDKITPAQMRSAAWISLIHNSTGLIYFCHQFGKGKSPRHLLEDPPMLAAVTALNKEIQSLAPVLNSATVDDLVRVSVQPVQPNVSAYIPSPVDILVKQHGGDTYIFAADMTAHPTRASFTIKDLSPTATAEVLGESRTIPIHNGQFDDLFAGTFTIHQYVIHGQSNEQ